MRDVWKMLGHLGHKVLPSGTEYQPSLAHGSYNIPDEPTEWATDYPEAPAKALPFHDEPIVAEYDSNDEVVDGEDEVMMTTTQITSNR